jgi:ParB family chromosome partitioning protein
MLGFLRMAFQGDSIFWVEIEKIVPNPFQPRREFNEEKLKELSESIRMYGILQPLTVTRNEVVREDGAFYTQYELIAGERRLRASKLAGLEQVPVIIRSGQDTEQEKLELAIIENLQREDLNAVDRALAFKQLADTFDLSHSQVAKKVGRSREYVSNSIRLLALPDYMLNSLKVGDITEGHARTLLMLKERPEELDVVFREILLKKLSVREVERIARKIATDKVRKKTWLNTDANLIEIEREFTDTLGTRVQISKTDFGGKLTIDYFSEDDLQKLLSIVKSQGKITDFHTAGSDALSDSKEEELDTLTHATGLERVDEVPVAEQAGVKEETVEVPMPTQQQTPDVLRAMQADVPVEATEMAGVVDVREVIQSEEAVSEVLEDVVVDAVHYAQEREPDAVVHQQPAPASSVAQAMPIQTTAEPQTATPQRAEEKKSDDDDLYSIRNFSL